MVRIEQAVVIGASLAGLATAAVLAPRARRVTLIEARPAPSGTASIAPQGPAPHLLLGGGRDALEAIYPGLAADLLAKGATPACPANRRLWYHGYRARPHDDAYARQIAPLCTRGLLESAVRARTMALANVTPMTARVDGLIAIDGRIGGVRLVEGGALDADLVVDCSGRGSAAGDWLRSAGFQAPRLETVGVRIRYLAMTCERRLGDADGDLAIFVQATPPAGQRFGLAFAVEGGRWQVLLGGYFGDAPPCDDAGFHAFAASLGAPDIAALIAGRSRLGDYFSFGFPASLRRRYGELRRPAAGFAPLGDALASFNPVFGQGMTSAALQALALGRNLDRHADPSAMVRAQLADAERITDAAWRLSTGPDLRYPQTVGRRAPGAKLVGAYADRALRAAIVDPVVATALSVTTARLRSPAGLLTPALAWRVLAPRRSGSG